jgi:hypothetical protein
MMFKPWLFFLLAILPFWGNGLKAQEKSPNTLLIHLQPWFQGHALSLEEENSAEHTGSLHIKTLRFYLSNFSLMKSGEQVWKEQNSYHLVDASEKSSMDISLDIPVGIDFDSIEFQLGIDSLTHVSGAMGGDLDPTNGMYWAWNSGYIHFKLEGTSPECPTRKHAFQFHLGGYLPPFAAVQTIRLMAENGGKLNINLNLSAFIDTLDLSREHTIMSPGEKAQQLSRIAATLFYVDEKK